MFCNLIQYINVKFHLIGHNMGVISYNETPIKKVILSGITTISTDFVMMGVIVAEMVRCVTDKQVAVPFRITERNSLWQWF